MKSLGLLIDFLFFSYYVSVYWKITVLEPKDRAIKAIYCRIVEGVRILLESLPKFPNKERLSEVLTPDFSCNGDGMSPSSGSKNAQERVRLYSLSVSYMTILQIAEHALHASERISLLFLSALSKVSFSTPSISLSLSILMVSTKGAYMSRMPRSLNISRENDILENSFKCK